jgi:cytosine/adenosine deaminase-related metal-dependent hydrolase
MPHTTCIRNADWVVAWDAAEKRHVYRQNIDVVFADDRIIHVGPGYRGEAQQEIGGKGRMVMPGLVNLHTHPSVMPFFKSLREELGNPKLYFTALYDGWNLFRPEPEDCVWAARQAYCEALLSGCTTLVDMCFPYPGWLDVMAESGIRIFISALYESQHWHTANGHELTYRPEPDGGKAAYDAAVKLTAETRAHKSGRLSAMIAPMAIDTTSIELIRAGLELARREKLPFQLHAGEAMAEFLEMTRRTGMTQVQLLAKEKLLGPDVTIGHGIFLDHHSWLHWYSREDMRILADHGCSVAHCPTPFSRYGIKLESFGAYLEAGINMGIGTDTHPHNMLEEMRTAAILARVAAENMHAVSTGDIFNAATVGGAKALMREDLGRLAPGAKADIVLVRLDIPDMMPAYDPLRSLIYVAADRAVSDVFVDGRQVVKDRRVLTIDHQRAAAEVAATQARVLPKVPERDRLGRPAEQVAPRTVPLRHG